MPSAEAFGLASDKAVFVSCMACSRLNQDCTPEALETTRLEVMGTLEKGPAYGDTALDMIGAGEWRRGSMCKQAGEDLVAWQTYFHGQHNGTFLEMGALDGALADLLAST